LWKIDTTKTGISAIFKEYQYEILTDILGRTEPVGTGDLHATMELKKVKCSRASVINWCQLLAENGILDMTEETSKGGHRRLYTAALSLEQIISKMVNDTLKKLLTVFPENDYLQFLNEEG
jgi:predicted transcriptional regulator